MSLSIAKFKDSRQIEAIKTAGLFPESMNDSAKNLVDFIEKYYEYLGTTGLPSYEINNITTEKDIDLASSNYLDEIQSLIAKNIPQSKALDKLSLYKIIFKYYHTRGSEDSIHSFFKIFFNEIVEIFYPKNFLFDLSAGTGEWGAFNPFSLRPISTNPNKKYMRVISEVEIAPKRTDIKRYDAKQPLLSHVRANLWTIDGSDSTDPNVAHIARIYISELNAFRWVYRYQGYYAQSDNDTTWPDTAKWSTIRRLFNYESTNPAIDDRDVIYEEVDDSDRILEFLNTIRVEAVAEPGNAVNEYVLSLETVDTDDDDVNLTDLKIYRLLYKNPSVWVETKVDGKFWTYSSERSMLSTDYKLQDSYYWQDFSYQIKSPVSSEEWLNSYFKFVHPSGLKLFTSLLLEFFNRNDWDEPIEFASRLSEDSDTFSWLNAYRAPRVGRHIPKFQPGWLTAAERLYTFILSALRQKYINVLGSKIIRVNPAKTVIATSGSITITEDAVAYTLVSNKSSAIPGEAITFTVTTTGTDDNTILYYSTSSSDYFDNPIGSVTIVDNTAQFTLDVKTDIPIEAETFIATLKTGSQGGPVVATSRSIVLNDDGPTYTLVSNRSSSYRGDLITFTVTTTGVNNGKIIYYTASSDSAFNNPTGYVTVIDNTAQFSLVVKTDITYQQFTVKLEETAAIKYIEVVADNDFVVGDKITIIGSSDDRLNTTHVVTESDPAYFQFAVDFDGPTVLQNNSVKILKYKGTPIGYDSYENMLCLILLKFLFKNANTRESVVHKEYQDWLKFIDSTQLISGYLDKPIKSAIDPYNERGEVRFNNISSYINLDKNYKILGSGSTKDSSNQFYPWKYSQIIIFEDDGGFFNSMYDSFSESYTNDIFEENQFDYNFSYTPDFIPPVISLTSPIIGEDSFGIIHQNGEDILLENSKHYHPPECINTFEFIHEDENIRVYEDGETKALVK